MSKRHTSRKRVSISSKDLEFTERLIRKWAEQLQGGLSRSPAETPKAGTYLEMTIRLTKNGKAELLTAGRADMKVLAKRLTNKPSEIHWGV